MKAMCGVFDHFSVNQVKTCQVVCVFKRKISILISVNGTLDCGKNAFDHQRYRRSDFREVEERASPQPVHRRLRGEAGCTWWVGEGKSQFVYFSFVTDNCCLVTVYYMKLQGCLINYKRILRKPSYKWAHRQPELWHPGFYRAIRVLCFCPCYRLELPVETFSRISRHHLNVSCSLNPTKTLPRDHRTLYNRTPSHGRKSKNHEIGASRLSNPRQRYPGYSMRENGSLHLFGDWDQGDSFRWPCTRRQAVPCSFAELKRKNTWNRSYTLSLCTRKSTTVSLSWCITQFSELKWK